MSILSQFFPGISGTYASTIPLNILVQAGGGGGGGHLTPNPAYTGGGGGAGGLGMTHNYRVVPGTTCPIVVGSGGAAGTPSGSNPGVTAASNGGFSAFNVPFDGKASSIRLEGGGAGGGVTDLTPIRLASDGGCGGGSVLTLTGNNPGVNGTTFGTLVSFPTTGGRGYYSTNKADNNGEIYSQDNTVTEWGVAYGHPGSYTTVFGSYNGNPTVTAHVQYGSYETHFACFGGSTEYNNQLSLLFGTGINGGEKNFEYGGKLSYITGTLTRYGRGGGIRSNQAGGAGGFVNYPASGYAGFPAPTTANSGNGGDGGCAGPVGDFSATAGQSGVVVVQYPSAYPAAPSFPGATDVSPATPGYRTYRFTSSGSITLP